MRGFPRFFYWVRLFMDPQLIYSSCKNKDEFNSWKSSVDKTD